MRIKLLLSQGLMLFLIETTAYSANQCNLNLILLRSEKAIESKLTEHGIDPDKIRFRYYINEYSQGSMKLEVLYKRKRIGGISTFKDPFSAKTIYTGVVGVDKEFRGQGIGALMYEVVAKLTSDLGLVYTKAYGSTTASANAMWRSLNAKGISKAGKVDVKNLKSNPEVKAVFKFFDHRSTLVRENDIEQINFPEDYAED